MAENSNTVPDKAEPIVIKKYANRRLYNTATSTYVTLDDLARMVQKGVEFVVYDARTKEDLTRAVLTQIIVEEEQKGHNLLPIGFLRQLIGLYGDSMQWMVPQYLETMMDWFATNQDAVRQQVRGSYGGVFPFDSIDAMSQRNMALFRQAMEMWNPFAAAGETPPRNGEAKADSRTAPTAEPKNAIEELRDQLAAMQQQLDALARRK